MKVLHVLNTSSFSGAENMVCQIINMFNDTDIEMAYCSRDGKIRNHLIENHIKFYSISDMCVSEINRIIDEYKPDILHAHDMRAAFITSQNKRKVPVVCHIHNNAFDSRRISKKSLAFLYASFKICHIFWVSKEAMTQYFFSAIVCRKSSVLYNIIDTEGLIKKLNEDQNNYSYDIVYVGRLSKEKNPNRLIEIIYGLKLKKDDIKMVIVGDGAYRDSLEELVKKKNLTNNVVFKGFQNNPYKIVKDSSIMIMTSLREGLPMSALESLAVGTPIISTPVGAMKDIIKNGENGFLCNENDEFIDRILKILDDKELLKRMSIQSKEFSKRFNDKNNFMKELTDTYNKVIR